MEQLLQYFIDESNKKHDEVRKEMVELNKKLSDLQTFKAEMVVSARWVSLLVSSVCGLVTMVTTALVSKYFQ